MITALQQLYYAWDLSHKKSVSDDSRFTGVLSEAKVDMNPHQVEAALFAFKSPLSKGAVLADEVGLGKTIEAGIILSEMWAERKRKILIIVPASLRNQWNIELYEKFYLPSVIMESGAFKFLKNSGMNPLNQGKNIIICSYNFAANYANEIGQIGWDLVVLDEAHKMRNVLRKKKSMALAISRSLKPYKKVLLTATPLQNNLGELNGLVSIIDPTYFSDAEVFSKKYNSITTKDSARFGDLKRRLQPIIHRTLRNQVQEYVKYTKRTAMVQEYIPTPEEADLYESVSNYLTYGCHYAISPIARPLMSLMIRRIMSSSAYALSFTLNSLIKKLEKYQPDAIVCDKEQEYEDIQNDLDEFTTDDIEGEFIEEVETDGSEGFSPKILKEEIEELKRCQILALRINEETKARKLQDALNLGFEKMAKLGANRKALIFTESRRTQFFLKKFLEDNGYRDKVVCFNGQNSDEHANRIYKAWELKNTGTSRISGSKAIDKKLALVDYFRDTAEIMICTEAGAEGINLQFCSLLVNYDMPWNPQRIEQRIGRCHRYGQKHDVVVINFVNKSNVADCRVYELLDEKFQLFNDVFGSSDEILGSLESGVEFERRLNQIYQTCRTEREINAAFDQLQKDLEELINERVHKTKISLLENFDEEVVAKLKIREAEDSKRVSSYNRHLWELSKSVLKDYISNADDEKMSFTLERSPEVGIPTGKYMLNKDHGECHQLRLSHPLGEYVVRKGLESSVNDLDITFDLSSYPFKKNLLERYKGCSGTAIAHRVKSENEYDSLEELIFCALADDGTILPEGFAESLLQLEAKDFHLATISNNQELEDTYRVRLDNFKKELSAKTNEYINSEIDKFEAWAQDQVYFIENEVISLRKDHDAIKRQIRKEHDARIKLALKEEETKLARAIRKKQSELFTQQDEWDEKVEDMTKKLRASMGNQIQESLFMKFRWTIV